LKLIRCVPHWEEKTSGDCGSKSSDDPSQAQAGETPPALDEKAARSQRMINSASGTRSYIESVNEQIDAAKANAEIIRKMIFASDNG